MTPVQAIADPAWIDNDIVLGELHCVMNGSEIVLMSELSLALTFIFLPPMAVDSLSSCSAVVFQGIGFGTGEVAIFRIDFGQLRRGVPETLLTQLKKECWSVV